MPFIVSEGILLCPAYIASLFGVPTNFFAKGFGQFVKHLANNDKIPRFQKRDQLEVQERLKAVSFSILESFSNSMNICRHFILRNKWVRCHNLSENKSFRILRTDVWQNKIILRQRLAGLCLGPVEVFIKMATQAEIPDLSLYLFKSYPSMSKILVYIHFLSS